MNNTDYSKAFKEVYIILRVFGNEIIDKIPIRMMNFIEENMEKNYIFFINEKIPIESQNFRNETLGIISLIYRDYIASKEERKKIIEDDTDSLNKLQAELSEKYNYDNLFKNESKNKNVDDNGAYSTELTIYEEKWYIKILNAIFKLFKKNNKSA